MGYAFVEAAAKGELARMAKAFSAAVELSYQRHPMNHRTQAEDKRRAEICVKHFRTMREEYRWGVERCLSHLQEGLDAELRGVRWSPIKTRTLYAPDEKLFAAIRRL